MRKQQSNSGEATSLTQMDSICTELLEVRKRADSLSKGVMLSRVIASMKQAFTPEVMRDIMSIQGCRLGFLTDRDKQGGYPPEVVRDCIIEAAGYGLYPCDNQFNIIQGSFCITKEGRKKILGDKGIRYSMLVGTPERTYDKAHDRTLAKCKVDLKWLDSDGEHEQQLEFVVRCKDTSPDDMPMGKAKSKALKWLCEYVASMYIEDAEDMMEQREDKESAAAAMMRDVTPKPEAGEPDDMARIQKALDVAAITDVTATDIREWYDTEGYRLNVDYLIANLDKGVAKFREFREGLRTQSEVKPETTEAAEEVSEAHDNAEGDENE